jgi:hypothetical protein
MLIYVASPYSGDEEAAYKKVCHVCCEIVCNRPWAVFSPIAHWHPIVTKYKLPTDAEYWWNINKEYLRKADVLLIVQLDGWDQSEGIKKEIEFATELRKPIRYFSCDSENWKMDLVEMEREIPKEIW